MIITNNRKRRKIDAKFQEITNLIAGFQKTHMSSLPCQTFNLESYHMTLKKMCNMAETYHMTQKVGNAQRCVIRETELSDTAVWFLWNWLKYGFLGGNGDSKMRRTGHHWCLDRRMSENLDQWTMAQRLDKVTDYSSSEERQHTTLSELQNDQPDLSP